MSYLIVTFLLFIFILLYFRIASRYNIIDKPNHRSAHSEISLRGGGIIYPIAFLLFGVSIFIFKNENLVVPINRYVIFGVGLFILCAVSFVDDVVGLSKKIRLISHFISTTLLLWFLNTFQILPIWVITVLYVLIIGILNAYNFMDGINGMSGLYSVVILSSLLYVDEKIVDFTDQDFIIYPLLASLVFLFFNFRKKAKCFMGDVGSMGIAFWVMALIGLLMVKTGELKYILFLAVYGVEVVLTILERLKLKENILEAHKRHLYQLFANDMKYSQLVISFCYALIQLIINLMVIFLKLPDWLMIPALVLPVVIFYLALKFFVKKNLSNQNV